MLIGNRESFALELTPVEPSWELRYEPEAAAWAGFSVWVAGKNLCAHVRDGEEDLRTAFFVPLGPIADWFVRSYPGIAFEERLPWFETSRRMHDLLRKWGEASPPAGIDEDTWLDGRDAFWSRHFLMAGAEGAWLPNIAFLREDDDVVLVWQPVRFLSGPPVTLLNAQGFALVSWRDVEAVLRRFVDVVAEAFERKKLSPFAWIASPLPRLHAVVAAATVDPIALFCARTLRDVAALLGVSEDEVAGSVGKEAASDPAVSALCQVLRDLPPIPSPGIGAEARSIVDASEHSAKPEPLRAWAAGRVLALDAARAGTTAEQAGQLAARAVRDELRLDEEPIVSTIDVLSGFGVGTRTSTCTTQHELMLVAAVSGGTPVATVLDTARTRTEWARRFEEARALGHALLDPLRGGALGAASTRWAQETRRRRSGAFAAELLLPASACEGASQGHLDGVYTEQTFEALLNRYNVGARTAAYQLYNHKWLSRAIRDELIDLHAREE